MCLCRGRQGQVMPAWPLALPGLPHACAAIGGLQTDGGGGPWLPVQGGAAGGGHFCWPEMGLDGHAARCAAQERSGHRLPNRLPQPAWSADSPTCLALTCSSPVQATGPSWSLIAAPTPCPPPRRPHHLAARAPSAGAAAWWRARRALTWMRRMSSRRSGRRQRRWPSRRMCCCRTSSRTKAWAQLRWHA